MPVILDAENIVTCNFADLVEPVHLLSRKFPDRGRLAPAATETITRAPLSPNSAYSAGAWSVELDVGTQTRRCEAGFRQSYGQTAITQIMGGLHVACLRRATPATRSTVVLR